MSGWAVRLEPAAVGDAERWFAAAVDASAGCELWHGEGPTATLALVKLIENMADELEERAAFLPDGYVDLDAR